VPQPQSSATPAISRNRISPSEIPQLPLWNGVVRSVEEFRDWLEEVQIDLTRIPAPTFHESERAAEVANRFRGLGLEKVRLDRAGNVIAERPGASRQAFVLTAHLDTVVPAGVPIEVQRRNGRIYAPGISDNGAGLAALLGTAAILQRAQVKTGLSLVFVANVGEEGEGDLYGIRELLSPGELRARAVAVLVLDGSSVQHITIAGLGSRRYLIEVSGPGGHSWKDFGRVNPILALSNVIGHLSLIPLSSEPRTTLNVGAIQGGTTVNAIPSAAWMKVDVRSTQTDEIERVSLALRSAVRAGIEQEDQRASGSLQAKVHVIGERPAAELAMPSRLLDVVRAADQYLGIQSRLERSSTDANIPLALGIDSVAIAGGGTGGDAHTPNEWYDPQGRDLGLKRILLTTLAMTGLADAGASHEAG
jgi:acetylornithine deacetylase/succinyl-diaminopimelate desuccinylase-like protein